MSKKSSTFARDVSVGDVIRLVYEIEVEEMGDLDAKFPSESDDLFFIKGKVVKGPLHKKNVEVEFAISGDDRLTITKRKSTWRKICERIATWGDTLSDKRKQKKAEAKLPTSSSGVAYKRYY